MSVPEFCERIESPDDDVFYILAMSLPNNNYKVSVNGCDYLTINTRWSP
jgi:hypothetical protein